MFVSEAFEAFEIDELLSEDRSHYTVENYQKACRSLLRSTNGDLPVELLMYAHVIRWKKDMFDAGLQMSYIAQQLRKLRTLLAYLQKHGYKTLDPSEIKLPKYKYRQTAWLTVDELARFLAVIESPRDKALFGCLFSSGARYSELMSLNRDSIVDGCAKIFGKGQKSKTDVPEELTFDENALKMLDYYLETRKDDNEALFISRENKRLSIQQADNISKKYAQLAGIDKNVTTHVFRHSFGSDLNLKGLDIYGISKQLRHANIDTTRIYIHGADRRKQSDYDKFHSLTPLSS